RRFADESAGAAKRAAAKAEAVSTFLEDMLASADPWNERGPDVTVRQILDDAAREVGGGSLAKQPEVEGAVRHALAGAYRNLGLYPEAEMHERRALEAMRGALGPDHADVATIEQELGRILAVEGKTAEAERLFTHALRIREGAFGGDSLVVSNTLIGMAQ